MLKAAVAVCGEWDFLCNEFTSIVSREHFHSIEGCCYCSDVDFADRALEELFGTKFC